MEQLPFHLTPGLANDPLELACASLAQALNEARKGVRWLRSRRLRFPDLDLLRRVSSLCDHLATALERPYLNSLNARRARDAAQERQISFLSNFRERLAYLGTDVAPQVWGHLGWLDDDLARPVALSRDGGQVILVVGSVGSGKTSFSTVLAESILQPGEPIAANYHLPTSYSFFHIEEGERLPQLLSALHPNPSKADLEVLKARLGVDGLPIGRLRLAVPASQLQWLLPRLQPYMDLGLEVVELKVQLNQLGQPGLEAALSADPDARYIRLMLEQAQDQGKDLTIEGMRDFIDHCDELNVAMKRAAHSQLRLLEEIASPPDGPGIWQIFEPGVATVVYLGGPHMGQGRAGPLVVALLSALMRPSPVHGEFQRVIAVDEVDLMAKNQVVWKAFIRTGRMVRHLGSTLILMGQDLLGAPDELYGVAGLVVVFEQRNPKIWDHVRERVGALAGWRFSDVSSLPPGYAVIAVAESTDPGWRKGARRVRIRPLRCMHGGMTRARI